MWGLLIRVCFRTVTQLITGRQCDHTPRWHALCMNKINLSWCLRSIENTSALLPRSLFSPSLPPLRHLLFCCCKVGCCDQANAAVCQFQLRPSLNCADSSQGRNRGGNIPTVNHLRFFCLAFSFTSNFNLKHSEVHCRKVKVVRGFTLSYKRGFFLCRHITFSSQSYFFCPPKTFIETKL